MGTYICMHQIWMWFPIWFILATLHQSLYLESSQASSQPRHAHLLSLLPGNKPNLWQMNSEGLKVTSLKITNRKLFPWTVEYVRVCPLYCSPIINGGCVPLCVSMSVLLHWLEVISVSCVKVDFHLLSFSLSPSHHADLCHEITKATGRATNLIILGG